MTKIELAWHHRHTAAAAIEHCQEMVLKCERFLALSIPADEAHILNRFIEEYRQGVALSQLEVELYDELIAKYS